ncbi:MAG: FRG domain-containing protein, partial [Methylococcales bacterium]|nr:FRG domain-containing protein [Methylococcales bacterium]
MLEINAGNSISSITKLLATHFSDEKKEIWFRGHSDYSWKLEPIIFRENYDEAGMYEEFIRRFPEHSHNHKNVFEWLTLMQHYGLPTRLLDWSENLLVALFFCCNDEKFKRKNGAVFAFIPKLDELSLLGAFDNVLDRDSDAKLLEPLITSTTKEDFCNEVFKLLSSEKFNVPKDIKINDLKLTEENKPSIIKAGTFKLSSKNTKNHPLFSWFYPYKPSYKNPRIRQQ